MQISVYSDFRFHVTPDGTIWTSSVFQTSFWKRYLDVFDSVQIVARAEPVAKPMETWTRVSASWLSFALVPFYNGLGDFLRHYRKIRNAIWETDHRNNAVILRASSNVASTIQRQLSRIGKPYGMEIIGDPYEAFGPGAVSHPLRIPMRHVLRSQLQQQVIGAVAVGYVSAQVLPERYSTADHATTAIYSSIELNEDAFVASPRQYVVGEIVHLVTIGSLAQMYKAPDVLIDAMAICRQQGVSFRLTWVGDGQYQDPMQQRANEKLGDAAQFIGRLSPGGDIREALDRADIFVLPSLTEGLPRAMIEAMARGLPCIGTKTGGIPELIDEECLVPRSDADALANRLMAFAADSERLTRLSQRNIEKARTYMETELRKERNRVYRRVYDEQLDWMKKQGKS